MRNPLLGTVTSNYDLRRTHPVFKTQQPHRGIDIATPGPAAGGLIRAAYAGRVAAVESNWRDLVFNWGCIWGRSGNGILIRNPDGEHQYYGHPAVVHVRQGQWVEEGQVIGVEGASGRVTGPHLHFEIHEWASGPGNNWSKTRDPRIDFRAAGITPGVDNPPIIIPAKTPSKTNGTNIIPATPEGGLTVSDINTILAELKTIRAEQDATNKRLDSIAAERRAENATAAQIATAVWDEPLRYRDQSRATDRDVPAREHMHYLSWGNARAIDRLDGVEVK